MHTSNMHACMHNKFTQNFFFLILVIRSFDLYECMHVYVFLFIVVTSRHMDDFHVYFYLGCEILKAQFHDYKAAHNHWLFLTCFVKSFP